MCGIFGAGRGKILRKGAVLMAADVDRAAKAAKRRKKAKRSDEEAIFLCDLLHKQSRTNGFI